MKIGIQVQSGVVQDFSKLLSKKPIAILLLGNALGLDIAQQIRTLSPQTLILLRTPADNWALDRTWTQGFVYRALQGGMPFLQRGLCDFLMPPNEPVVTNVPEAQLLNDLQVEVAQDYHANGFQTGAYTNPVGNPPYNLLPYLRDGILACGGWWFTHQYGAPDLQTDSADLSLRHRNARGILNIPDLKIGITECGIDLGIIGQGGGYRALPDNGHLIQDYVDLNLSWWDNELAKDDYVKFTTLFGYAMEHPWETFDVAAVDTDRSYFINWLQGGVVPPNGGGVSTAQERINAAWGGTGVDFNPDAAFFKFAQANKLGYPVTNEYRYTDAAGGKRAGQGFSVAFVECADGDWANIKPYDWLTGELYVAPVNPPNGGIPPFAIPPALTQFGASAVEGTVVSGKPFYRLTGATVRAGVSAFCKITVVGKSGAPLIGVYVINLRPDGNKEIQVTDGSGVVQFFYGAGSAFSVPGSGPFTNGVVDSAGNFLQGDKAISLGDYQGTHTEWYLQFTQVQ